jgi:hypothetical protein
MRVARFVCRILKAGLNIIVNMAGSNSFISKSHDETDGTPRGIPVVQASHRPAQATTRSSALISAAATDAFLNERAPEFRAERPSTASAQEKRILKATETLRSRQLSS